MSQRTDIPIPAFAGGINDSEPDALMSEMDVIELLNAIFDTPDSVGVRPGSVDGAALLDDVGGSITSIPFVGMWDPEPAGPTLVAVGHITGTTKHWFYVMQPDGTAPVRFAMPAGYNHATPYRFVGASWFDAFYAFDVGQAVGLFKFDGGAVTLPTYTLAAGPAAALRPSAGMIHRNHLWIFNYGDENNVVAGGLGRFSGLGDPDTFNPTDTFPIGDDGDPVLLAMSMDEFGLLFKERKIHRLEGADATSWGQVPWDNDRGVVGPRAACRWAGKCWFVSEQGFCVVDATSGPSKLIVDRVRLKWYGFDNLSLCWVTPDPDRQAVVFGMHQATDGGTEPTMECVVDTRSLRWAMRQRSGAANWKDATTMPQTGAAGPVVAPVMNAATNIQTVQLNNAVPAQLLSQWDDNWTWNDPNADTRLESADADRNPGIYAEDAAVNPGSPNTLTITGKRAGTHYTARARHQKNGLFGPYSNVIDVRTPCAEPGLVPNVGVLTPGTSPGNYSTFLTSDRDPTGASTGPIDAAPADHGYFHHVFISIGTNGLGSHALCNVVIQRTTAPGGVINAGGWADYYTFVDVPEDVTLLFIDRTHAIPLAGDPTACSDYAYRARTTRAGGFTDSNYGGPVVAQISFIPSDDPLSGAHHDPGC